MTTAKQIEANQQNALASTGPKTTTGKTRVSKNAVKHGVYATLPVLPDLERVEEWETHRTGILTSLGPAGALEQTLAERVALCMWRLKRVAAYETAVTAVGLECVEERLRPRLPRPNSTFFVLPPPKESDENDRPLPDALGKAIQEQNAERQELEYGERTLRLLERLSQLPEDGPVSGDDAWSCFQDLIEVLPKDAEHSDPEDANFVAYVGVPKDELDEPYEWSGWSAGMARKGWALLAKQGKKEPEKLLARAIDLRRAQQNYQEKKIQGLDGKVKALRRRIKVQESRLTRQRILPDGKTLQKVTRYEAHLSRQMYQALHELQRLQAARSGEHVTPPAALDVTLDASESAAASLEANGLGNTK
jgi:hypothetical protein